MFKGLAKLTNIVCMTLDSFNRLSLLARFATTKFFKHFMFGKHILHVGKQKCFRSRSRTFLLVGKKCNCLSCACLPVSPCRFAWLLAKLANKSSNHWCWTNNAGQFRQALRTTVPSVSYVRNSLRFWYYASISTCCQNLEKKIGVTGKIWEKAGGGQTFKGSDREKCQF